MAQIIYNTEDWFVCVSYTGSVIIRCVFKCISAYLVRVILSRLMSSVFSTPATRALLPVRPMIRQSLYNWYGSDKSERPTVSRRKPSVQIHSDLKRNGVYDISISSTAKFHGKTYTCFIHGLGKLDTVYILPPSICTFVCICWKVTETKRQDFHKIFRGFRAWCNGNNMCCCCCCCCCCCGTWHFLLYREIVEHYFISG